MTLLQSLQVVYRRHTDFFLLTILFVTFRVLALAAFRPGGLVLDFSDFYWYRDFAQLTRQGYYPYNNLWTTYPPLFPLVMIAIYQLSALLPPWNFPNLWFTLLLGGFFLLFEIGNFILLYLFALKLFAGEPAIRPTGEPANERMANGERANDRLRLTHYALRPTWIYATLFVPVYTLTGWFESYPLFFFLLSLYLLLRKRPYLSAFFTGIGLMIKLIPLILVPVAVQIISTVRCQVSGVRCQVSGVRYQFSIFSLKFSIFQQPAVERQPRATGHQSPIATSHTQVQPSSNLKSKTRAERSRSIQNLKLILPFDLPRIALYSGIFVVTVIIIATPFYLMNPDLIFGPQQITGARQPWETVWALIDGNYDYGVIPLDMRNLAWTPGEAPPTHIPWLAVTAVFGLIYTLFYTRPLDWSETRTVLAFVGFTLCLFMLWSKGYSPQWLGWPLFFVALLLPNLRGVIYAAILSVTNIIEANFYVIIFPAEHWLLVATVLIRAFLLLVLAAEFLLVIWPRVVTPKLAKIRAWALAVFIALLLVGTIPAGWQLGRSYFNLRLRQSPYAATITRLQGEQVKGALLLNSHAVYDWFYPYLRQEYDLVMLDDYAPPGQSVEVRTTTLLNRIAAQTNVLWIYDADASVTTPSEEVLATWLSDRPPAHIQDIDGGRLYLYILR